MQRGSAHDAPAQQEFVDLARSAGALVVAELVARVDRPDARYFIGSGKADELRALRQSAEADLILVDHALSPVQERNLERLAECRVVDRTGLILDIFAQRARSHEGKLQVELAQLTHLSTRLVRGWTHLERQRGGAIGLRGPGETQLEVDRRLLAERVKQLRRRLDKVETQRSTARRARRRSALPVVALVGYTNAGKSTLFNLLTGASAYAADQLFATLDPTLRRVEGLDCGPLLLADTVGFIRELPHDLVAAFRSTLAEARDSDLLLHVIDASDPEREAQRVAVEAVLAEIGADQLPQVLVYNKVDRLEGAAPRVDRLDGGATPRVWLSALSGLGLPALREVLAQELGTQRVNTELVLPSSAGRLRARLHERGLVRAEVADEGGWRVQIDASRLQIEPLFRLPGGDGEWLRKQVE